MIVRTRGDLGKDERLTHLARQACRCVWCWRLHWSGCGPEVRCRRRGGFPRRPDRDHSCLRTAANPDTRTIQDTADTVGKMMNLTRERVLADLDPGTWLKVSPHTEDTANGAVLLASDRARMITRT